MDTITPMSRALVALALCASAHAAQPDQAESLIASAKQAMGGSAWDKVATWQ